MEFDIEWRRLCGELVVPDNALLKSLCLANEHVSGDIQRQTLCYFPRSELPIAPPERFSRLFKGRQRWFYDDLIPFVEYNMIRLF